MGLGRVSGPHLSSGMAAYHCAGVSGARVAVHHRPHSRAHSSPIMRASHAAIEPRPMIHGGKRASCRCFEKSLAGPGTGGGPLVPGTPECHSRHGGRLQSPYQGAGEGGGWSPSAAVSHRCTRPAALRGLRRSCSSRLLRSSHAKSPSWSMWWRKSSTEVPTGGS